MNLTYIRKTFDKLGGGGVKYTSQNQGIDPAVFRHKKAPVNGAIRSLVSIVRLQIRFE